KHLEDHVPLAIRASLADDYEGVLPIIRLVPDDVVSRIGNARIDPGIDRKQPVALGKPAQRLSPRYRRAQAGKPVAVRARKEAAHRIPVLEPIKPDSHDAATRKRSVKRGGGVR